MAHTPGPWVLLPGADWPAEEHDLVAEADPDRAIAVLQRGIGSNPANARLIAAAPDLLAALKVALKQIEDLDEVLNQSDHQVYGWHLNGQPEPVGNFFAENDYGAVEIIRAAIAKATGEAA